MDERRADEAVWQAVRDVLAMRNCADDYINTIIGQAKRHLARWKALVGGEPDD